MTTQLSVMYSKLHRATVTQADLHYEGSLTIDQDLMDAAKLYNHQQIDIYNITTGSRYHTYAIPGERGSGVIQANGAAAHHTSPGDLVIIVAYAQIPQEEMSTWEPTVVLLDEQNRPKGQTSHSGHDLGELKALSSPVT